MNKIILLGRLTKDPELKYTNNNLAFCQFTIAVNRAYNSTTNGQPSADFINCVVWRKQAENLAKYQRKGNQIIVEGRLETRSYNANDGSKRYITEVICDSIHFVDNKSNTNENADNRNNLSRNNQYTQEEDINSPYDFIPDKDPFEKENKQKLSDIDVNSALDVSNDDLPF